MGGGLSWTELQMRRFLARSLDNPICVLNSEAVNLHMKSPALSRVNRARRDPRPRRSQIRNAHHYIHARTLDLIFLASAYQMRDKTPC